MKKMIMMLLVCLLALLPCNVMAEEVNEAWYELSADDTVLTVRLPGNTNTGLEWNFEISDGAALELLTHETIEGEANGTDGAETTYVASFMAIANEEKSVSLILRYEEENGVEAAEATRVLDLTTSADNVIKVNSVLERNASAEWCEFSEDGRIFVARLSGADWSFEIVDEEAIELLTCDSSEGGFVASFMATAAQAGNAEIVFTSDDGRYVYTVNTAINENGEISANWVDTFEIFE